MDERDELWELLGKAKEPAVSPFFSRNVLRAVREVPQRIGILAWLRQQWRYASITATALLVFGISIGHWNAEQRAAESDRMLLVQQVASNPDYEVINHLDELLAVQETSLWTDSSAE